MPSQTFDRDDRRHLAHALQAGMTHGNMNTYQETFNLNTTGNLPTRSAAIIRHIFENEADTDRYVLDLLNALYVDHPASEFRMDSDAYRTLETRVLNRHGVTRTSQGYVLPDQGQPTAAAPASAAEPAPPATLPLPPRPTAPTDLDARKRVAVIYGQDQRARTAMFTFLRALHLVPLEFETIVNDSGEGSPFTGAAIDLAFTRAQAIVALITPDEWAALHPDLGVSIRRLQARPNVIFEAGLAFGRVPSRTIIVTYGDSDLWSDIDGRHRVAMDNSPERRQALRDRLQQAGCLITHVSSDYLSASGGGDFSDFARLR
ncbi:hypothetical protein C5C86_13555 [Rathayibacter sp. AY1E4]|jgi:predicted nucleotide-binding protein|uniref:TIR domain-containing protein n=1 Tax=unclassified Rathayibacter TaxID=2609250 RepID=UPI000CE80999|nr:MULTISPECIES: TIR domain-containing protein [unclassified Rathayibacter]PPF09990.1 hypothetical protein C5B98_14035 [Rathayibacter sp. AY1A5]PPF33136.1 hypothetical protein C5B93_14320 [Rathayibacter sp. AY1A2]PPG37167.1 hypothetical protein C5C30_13950 [Rathayibacter sp. AY2B5]PPH08260.1 hypothetical protein C5C71_13125 [Rathayibacter sp. AY1C1]PPH14471.1 hypothetical protein C5C35_14530 [Rathayibacter sp. AY1F8]